MRVGTGIHIQREARVNLGIYQSSALSPSCPVLETGSLTDQTVSKKAKQTQSPACLCLPSTETTVHDNTPGYFLWALDTELGPCGCMANVLSTELSPQPYLLALGASQKL